MVCYTRWCGAIVGWGMVVYIMTQDADMVLAARYLLPCLLASFVVVGITCLLLASLACCWHHLPVVGIIGFCYWHHWLLLLASLVHFAQPDGHVAPEVHAHARGA